MLKLHHALLDPPSRFIRLLLAEYGLEAELMEEKLGERREEFLALNPDGTLPVMIDDGVAVCGAGPIAEYLDETRGQTLGSRRLFPASPAERAEIRRLTLWFGQKFYEEVSQHLVHEKFTKRSMLGHAAAPDVSAIRAAKNNIRYHLQYIGFLVAQRNFIGGEYLTIADFAAAAHLSSADYLGDVPWQDVPAAQAWYARMKSRPSFRAVLADRLPGMAPPGHYSDLDF